MYIFFFCCLNFLFFSLRGSEIYLCCVRCFYFCKITVFITGNEPLVLKIFNNKTDIYFCIISKLPFFLLRAVIYYFIVEFSELHLPPKISFIDLFLSLSCQLWMVIKALFQITSGELRPLKSDWNCLKWPYIFTSNIFFIKWWPNMERWIWRNSFFSHGKSNSCGVAISYCATEDFEMVNTACDKNGRILISDA